MNRSSIPLAGLAAILLLSSPAHAEILDSIFEAAPPASTSESLGATQAANRGVVRTSDERRILVNKLQQDGRWTVTLDRDREDVTGIVTSPSQEVTFLRCVLTGATGDPDDPYDTTFFAVCETGVVNTGFWNVLGAITIPGAFFLP